MPKLTFTNSQGELVSVTTTPTTKAKKEFAAIMDQVALSGAVVITRYNIPKVVLLSYSEFESMVSTQSRTLDEFGTDVLLAHMQSQKARKAMDTAFTASPSKLGSAAVKAFRKKL